MREDTRKYLTQEEINALLPPYCHIRWNDPNHVTQETIDRIWELYDKGRKYAEEKRKAPGRERL